MSFEIVNAYSYPREIKELFCEYFDIIRAGDDNFDSYLMMQDVDEELLHLEKKYGMPQGRLYLLLSDGAAAGCVALKPVDGRCGELKRLFVRGKYRNMGYGQVLVQKIIDEARRIGYDYIRLDTLPFLESAIGLYKKLGFTETEPFNVNPMCGSIYMRLDIV